VIGVIDFAAIEAEVLKQRQAEAASEQAFRSQPSMQAKFYRHQDGQVWFTAEHFGGVGGLRDGGDVLNTPANDTHRANYPAEYAAFIEAEKAPSRK
jgi:hypothetical protein